MNSMRVMRQLNSITGYRCYYSDSELVPMLIWGLIRWRLDQRNSDAARFYW